MASNKPAAVSTAAGLLKNYLNGTFITSAESTDHRVLEAGRQL